MPAENITHLFQGIPNSKLDPELSSQENLENLREDFARLGIEIGQNVSIGNSTLEQLLLIVNTALEPPEPIPEEMEILLGGCILGPSAARTAEDLENSKDDNDFNITIGDNVIIGENCHLDSSVKIGKNTIIGDKVIIGTGTEIGDFCEISSHVFFGTDCTVGDCTKADSHTTVGAETVIHPRSQIVYRMTRMTNTHIQSALEVAKTADDIPLYIEELHQAIEYRSIEGLMSAFKSLNQILTNMELAHFQPGNGIEKLQTVLTQFLVDIESRHHRPSTIIYLGDGHSRIRVAIEKGEINVSPTSNSTQEVIEAWEKATVHCPL